MNIGISTIYFSKDIVKRNISWWDIKKKLKELELQNVELNADIPIEWMNEIKKDVSYNEIGILSLHNFCPAADNIPAGRYGFNAYSLNSPDEEERKLALKYTLRTIDYAKELNAKAIVLHLGEITTQPTGLELYKIASQVGVNSEIYLEYKNSLLLSRQKNKQKYFDLLYKTMDVVIKHAEEKNVNLAMETRFFPDEIPNFEEINEIIEHYKSPNIFYWHDFGHVEIQIRLGFVKSHKLFFDTYKKYLIGYHIHGVKSLSDHFSPYNTEISYSSLLKYEDDKIYILEVHNKENFSLLAQGVKFIKSVLNGKKQITKA